MKKNFNNIFTISILLFFLILIFVFSKEIIISILYALEIWKNNIIPSLFPIFVITDLLINYGFVDIIKKLTNKSTSKLFNLSGETSFVIIASILSGFPSSAKYIKELLERKIINSKQAQYLLSFTHFPNPLFIIGVVGENLLKSKKIGVMILFSIALGNILIAFITKEKKTEFKENTKISTIHSQKKNFITVISNSIIKTANTLILILGIIITFLIISTIINNLIGTKNIFTTLLNGILEITQGINYISAENISIFSKTIIITGFTCFGGISIHMQIMSILSYEKIKYSKYLFSRILHCIISSFIIYILLILFL